MATCVADVAAQPPPPAPPPTPSAIALVAPGVGVYVPDAVKRCTARRRPGKPVRVPVAERLLNEPAFGVVPPIAGGVAKFRLPLSHGVAPLNVGRTPNDCADDHVLVPLRSGTVAPLVPVFCVAALPSPRFDRAVPVFATSDRLLAFVSAFDSVAAALLADVAAAVALFAAFVADVAPAVALPAAAVADDAAFEACVDAVEAEVEAADALAAAALALEDADVAEPEAAPADEAALEADASAPD
ncbi:hypothetical protein PT2222_330051 [Paraburkholderia tropica]